MNCDISTTPIVKRIYYIYSTSIFSLLCIAYFAGKVLEISTTFKLFFLEYLLCDLFVYNQIHINPNDFCDANAIFIEFTKVELNSAIKLCLLVCFYEFTKATEGVAKF